ncbi:MAG: DNA-3-methyladenine glycosylase family protein [Limisphaerales bacterium]
MKLVQQYFPVCDYDLAATLTSGQAFRWRAEGEAWEGVIGNHWVRLHQESQGISATAVGKVQEWTWLRDYLQLDLNFGKILESFPADDPALQEAVRQCRGLRLLRQDPWECLASFILSSTKQIVQIQQIVALVCERFGDPLPVPPGHSPVYSFPSAERLAQCSEQQIRDCKMGFRAPNLLKTAQMVARGEIDLPSLYTLPLESAREALVQLPGVGRKIADCVLLFAYGFPKAFPIDVWILKALRQLYFPKRKPTAKRLIHFSETHFGPHAGYAQQYLFHYMRTKL